MSSITPLRFTGVSSFSEDFQAIFTRATQIASIPIQQLQNQQSHILAKKQAVVSLNQSLQNLTSSVEHLGELGRTRSIAVSSSNANKVSVADNGVVSATNYSITEITSVAAAASETSSAPLSGTDAVDTDDTLELVLGGETFALDVSTTGGNNLAGLAAAINGSGAAVTATILDTGAGSYLSLTATSPGEQVLQVRRTAGDAGSNILTANNQGSNARFLLNGLPVVQTDNVVSSVIPGITFTILDTTSANETITLSARSSRGSLATALTGLATAYNAARDQVKQQIGERAGVLSGEYLVGEVSRTLRKLTGFQGTGAVKSLAEIGIELDKNGVMSFDSTKFYALNTASVEGAFDFLGSETTGFGGLSKDLQQLSHPLTGLLRTQQDNYDVADRRAAQQVADISTRIERMQSMMSLKLQQADALLAGLQSQQSALEASLKAVSFAAYGKNQ